jgi:hypothetical protein
MDFGTAVCENVCVGMYVCVCIYVCMYAYMYVRMYACVCMCTYVWNGNHTLVVLHSTHYTPYLQRWEVLRCSWSFRPPVSI